MSILTAIESQFCTGQPVLKMIENEQEIQDFNKKLINNHKFCTQINM